MIARSIARTLVLVLTVCNNNVVFAAPGTVVNCQGPVHQELNQSNGQQRNMSRLPRRAALTRSPGPPPV
ncbi:hypothetical protein DPEC_G00081600 [Dallia pectoralis]|uniref:Uncharacterized protein n=1 Tax=Dallia pectoralis TaxID=75939 RepID=A0ACC2GYA8_DALPE|nr:hypothetical protein DPEC_G00081600 [Dallia pectoralis]